jgi:hypothetical protein
MHRRKIAGRSAWNNAWRDAATSVSWRAQRT